jgi:hypothetical protein
MGDNSQARNGIVSMQSMSTSSLKQNHAYGNKENAEMRQRSKEVTGSRRTGQVRLHFALGTPGEISLDLNGIVGALNLQLSVRNSVDTHITTTTKEE